MFVPLQTAPGIAATGSTRSAASSAWPIATIAKPWVIPSSINSRAAVLTRYAPESQGGASKCALSYDVPFPVGLKPAPWLLDHWLSQTKHDGHRATPTPIPSRACADADEQDGFIVRLLAPREFFETSDLVSSVIFCRTLSPHARILERRTGNECLLSFSWIPCALTRLSYQMKSRRHVTRPLCVRALVSHKGGCEGPAPRNGTC